MEVQLSDHLIDKKYLLTAISRTTDAMLQIDNDEVCDCKDYDCRGHRNMLSIRFKKKQQVVVMNKAEELEIEQEYLIDFGEDEDVEELKQDDGPFCCHNYVHHPRSSAVALLDSQETLIKDFMSSSTTRLSLTTSTSTSAPFTITPPPTPFPASITCIYKVNTLTNHNDTATYLFQLNPQPSNINGAEPAYICFHRCTTPQAFDPAGHHAYLAYLHSSPLSKKEGHKSDMLRVGVREIVASGVDGQWRSTGDKRLDKELGLPAKPVYDPLGMGGMGFLEKPKLSNRDGGRCGRVKKDGAL